MNSRKMSSFVIVILLSFGRIASSQANGVEVSGGSTAQIFGGKSPVVKVSDAEGRELASIPIEKDPGKFIYSESANTLYVVHNEKKYEHSISAVNLSTNRVEKLINAKPGIVVDLILSSDGRRLFCYTAGDWEIQGADYYRIGDLKPPYEPTVIVIDTTSNEVAATYDWFESLKASVPQTRLFTGQMLAAGDNGRLIVLSRAGVSFHKKPIAQQLEVFSGRSLRSSIDIAPGARVVASMFSKDEKFLFVALEGEKSTEGSLVVVDLEKGASISHALSDHPTRLFRLGSEHEPWVLGDREMRSLSETGELGDRWIPLSKSTKSEQGGESGSSAFLDGFPGETLSLADGHAAIQINNKNGGSRHKLALVDLKKLKVEAIIPTMSTAELAGIRTGRLLTAFGMSMATGGVLVFIPSFIRNESLAARPDGRFLFALDLESHEVTVVDVQTATVVRRISVNKFVTKLQVSSDGKHLICFGKKIQQINLETNDLES